MLAEILFIKAMIIQQSIVAIIYMFQGDWLKMTYWASAAILTTSVMLMK
jgi:hypothetical protein